MVFKVDLSSDEIVTLLAVLESSGHTALAVKVRDQIQTQREEAGDDAEE
jgi:hypothetical protein